MRRRLPSLLVLLAACRPAPAPPPPPPEVAPEVPRQLRRLSNQELNAVASDLAGHPLDLLPSLLKEPRVEGFDDDTESLLVTDFKLDDFVATAELVSSELAAALAPCTEAQPETCALDFAAGFGRRAYGRPLTQTELDRLGAVYRVGAVESHAEGVKLLVQALMLSPNFLYRSELGGGPGATRLTPYETASAISFLITGGRPDEALITAAITGQLDTAEQRVAHAQRLLASERGRLRLRDLLISWLDLHEMEQVNKASTTLDLFSVEVRRSMAKELDAYLDDAVWGADGTLAGLFSATRGFPNSELLPFYGDQLRGPVGDFTPVPLDETRRRGVLSLAGFLAHHSGLDHTAPVQRGLFVRARLLCQEVAPPPPKVLLNPPTTADVTHTNREKYAAHSQSLACSGCHTQIDPIGFGFENFDFLGRYQTTDNGFPVDASGALTGTDVDGAFTGPAQLGPMLAHSGEVRRCYAQNLWRGAMGRQVTLPDSMGWPADAKLSAVLLDVVRSDGFVRRVAGEGEGTR